MSITFFPWSCFSCLILCQNCHFSTVKFSRSCCSVIYSSAVCECHRAPSQFYEVLEYFTVYLEVCFWAASWFERSPSSYTQTVRNVSLVDLSSSAYCCRSRLSSKTKHVDSVYICHALEPRFMSPLFPFQAANYLDIKGLLDVTCKTVANMIKGKTPEEIRKTFNIKNDFTEEEEAQVDSSSPFHLSHSLLRAMSISFNNDRFTNVSEFDPPSVCFC